MTHNDGYILEFLTPCHCRNQQEKRFVETLLGIIHNISLNDGNRHYLRDAGLVPVAQEYLQTSDNIGLLSLSILSGKSSKQNRR